MARTEAQTRKLFDQWAATYDADVRQESGIATGRSAGLRTVEATLPVQPGMYVLDIGIGTGALAERIASRDARIVGVDPSEKMLALCREQHPDYELLTGTFNAIPVNDSLFDCVVSSFAFHEVPISQRGAACAEMARVLKSGGYLCLVDIMFASQTAMSEAREFLANEWDEDEDYAIIGELDALLRHYCFAALRWQQTAPFHWMVVAHKP